MINLINEKLENNEYSDIFSILLNESFDKDDIRNEVIELIEEFSTSDNSRKENKFKHNVTSLCSRLFPTENITIDYYLNPSRFVEIVEQDESNEKIFDPSMYDFDYNRSINKGLLEEEGVLNDLVGLGFLCSKVKNISSFFEVITGLKFTSLDDLVREMNGFEVPKEYISESMKSISNLKIFMFNKRFAQERIDKNKLLLELQYLSNLADAHDLTLIDNKLKHLGLDFINSLPNQKKFQAKSILENPYGKISYNGYNLMKMDIMQQMIKNNLIYISEIHPPPYSGMKYRKTRLGKEVYDHFQTQENV